MWKRPVKLHNGTEYKSFITFENNIRKLVRLIKDKGGKQVMMTFAWHIPKDYTREKFDSNILGYNNPTNYDKCPVELWGSVEYVRTGLAAHNDIIRRISEEEGVMMIDQANNLGNEVKYFGDVCHLSEEGTDYFISNIINYFISRNLLSK